MRRRLRKRKQVTWHQKVAAGDRKIITRLGLHFADLAEENAPQDTPSWALSAIGGKTYRSYIENLNL